jgi:hypothetical protein
MGWEVRNGHSYYYRSRRVNGKPVREYHGTGLRALLAVEQDEADRAQREERRRAVAAELAEIAALEAPLAAFCAAAETIARAALLATGHHRHDRGEWRRRSGGGHGG